MSTLHSLNIRRFAPAALSLVVCAALSSCHHKDLVYEDNSRGEIRIEFDWRYAPDADPASMAALLYPSTGSPAIRFDFTGRNGGTVALPVDIYSGIAFNSDITDWAKLGNTDDFDSFEIYTGEAQNLTASGTPASSLPSRSEMGNGETLAKTPLMLWYDRGDTFTLRGTDEETVFTFYPKEAVSHYTVDVIDVKNIENARSLQVDGTISDMAGGWLPARDTASSRKVSFPFTLTPDTASASMHSEFLTFGEIPDTLYDHYIVIYLILEDGSGRYYKYDVTDQIRNAPDPRHVHITIRGLEIPQPLGGGTGLIPDVNEWQPENIDLDM